MKTGRGEQIRKEDSELGRVIGIQVQVLSLTLLLTESCTHRASQQLTLKIRPGSNSVEKADHCGTVTNATLGSKTQKEMHDLVFIAIIGNN